MSRLKWLLPCMLDLGVHHFSVIVLIGRPSLDCIINPSALAENRNQHLLKYVTEEQ